ncbi:MAG: ABC transporter permease [candidate division Zixibacteria bacterium]|nr:ABC transporter permease [candidate division Zixibacteria bacterium]
MSRNISEWLKGIILELQEMFFFSAIMVERIFRRPIYLFETFEQMHFIGIGSLYLVILTGMFAGQGMAIQFTYELADMGSKNYLGRIMAIAIIRELGPVRTGLMIAARVSSGITAEIAAMVSSNQVDALRAFGVDPIRKLAIPRLISLMVMVPILTVIADAVALLGGWMIATFIAHISSTLYWSNVLDRLRFGNIAIGLIKPVVFSLVIAFIACYKGFTTTGGTKGVGKSTTESVVLSSITILLVNFLITKLVVSLFRGYL